MNSLKKYKKKLPVLVCIKVNNCTDFLCLLNALVHRTELTSIRTSRYSVLEISVLNNKNNLIEFKNIFKFLFTCRCCLYIFLCTEMSRSVPKCPGTHRTHSLSSPKNVGEILVPIYTIECREIQ